MRLDIPQEPPRRREGSDIAPGSSDGRAVVRKLPDNPILRRLKSLEKHPTGDSRSHPPIERRRAEPARDMPRERRRPVASVMTGLTAY
jgi:hypothetical protein